MSAKALLASLPVSWRLCIILLLVHHSYITKVRNCQSGICLKIFFSFPLPFQVTYFLILFHKPLPTQSTVLAAFILALASNSSDVSTSSDKCPWPLWNSISPARPFPQCECIVTRVCYSWHAEQQGLLTSNYRSNKLTLLGLNKCLPYFQSWHEGDSRK